MAYQSLQDLAKSMGIQATSPSLNTQTTTPRTIPSNQVYTPVKPSTTPAPVVGNKVGNISNNPAYGPVGQVITREGLQKIASGQDVNNPSPKAAYIAAAVGEKKVSPEQNKGMEGYFANQYDKTQSGTPTSTFGGALSNANPFGTGVAGAQTVTPVNTNPINSGANLGNSTPTATIPAVNTGSLMAGTGSFTANSSGSTTGTTQTPTSIPTSTTPPAGVDQTKWAGYLQDLTDLKNKFQPALEQKQKELADIATKQSEQGAGLMTQGGEGTIGFGRAGLLQGLAAQQQAIKQKELDQLMSSYNAQAGILQGQVGATQPQAGAAFYGTPETGNLKGTGSVFQAGTLAGQQSLGQQYPAMKSAVDTATSYNDAIQKQLGSTNLNNLPLNVANNAVQWIRGQLGDANQKQLGNLIGNYVSTLQGAGLIGSDTAIGQQIVDTLAQGGSIGSVLNNLQSIANTKLQSTVNAGTGQTSAIPTTQTFTGGTGSTTNTSNVTYNSQGYVTSASF